MHPYLPPVFVAITVAATPSLPVTEVLRGIPVQTCPSGESSDLSSVLPAPVVLGLAKTAEKKRATALHVAERPGPLGYA
jgi:hypothetical protein